MTAKRVSFWVALPPNIANPKSNAHWGQKARAKSRYQGAAGLRIRSQLHPLPMFKHAAWRAHFIVAGPYDDDNRVALLKWIADTMVQIGMIPNDNPKHLTLAELPTQKVVHIRKRKQESFSAFKMRKRQAGYRVEVEIWERSPSGRGKARRAPSAASPG